MTNDGRRNAAPKALPPKPNVMRTVTLRDSQWDRLSRMLDRYSPLRQAITAQVQAARRLDDASGRTEH